VTVTSGPPCSAALRKEVFEQLLGPLAVGFDRAVRRDAKGRVLGIGDTERPLARRRERDRLEVRDDPAVSRLRQDPLDQPFDPLVSTFDPV
jgi:hypothetical protein